jgi:hypothetical protein
MVVRLDLGAGSHYPHGPFATSRCFIELFIATICKEGALRFPIWADDQAPIDAIQSGALLWGKR